MNTEDCIWALVAKRVGGEANAEDLEKLDKLLKKRPSISRQIKIIVDWWQEDTEEETTCHNTILFEKIKEKIKATEASKFQR
ncbi:MAG TPA: hypothetical protein VIM89_15515 [Mucilaginibacter sp.]